MQWNQSISSNGGKHKITINGVTTIVVGNNVNVQNGKIFVDGNEYTDHEELSGNYKILNVTIEGDVGSVKCDGNLTVNGNINENINTGGSCTLNGDLNGNLNCGGSCKISGSHKGNLMAGGSVRIG